jgi:ADP-ribose pyrophosphatase YjhB (NUDIX family)
VALIPYIRVRAIILFRRGSDVLLVDHEDPVEGLVWGIPGGGVEFGEHALDAARREAIEEVGVDPGELRLLSTFENIFQYAGETGHEVVFAYDADATALPIAAKDVFEGQESDGTPLLLRWVKEADVAARPTWPAALVALARIGGAQR